MNLDRDLSSQKIYQIRQSATFTVNTININLLSNFYL